MITNVLDSADATSCINAIERLGATVTRTGIAATGGLSLRVDPIPEKRFPENPTSINESELRIDVGNSGTSLYLLTAIAATNTRRVCFDGDESIRRREAGPLLTALRELGASVTGGPAAPYCVAGPIGSGRISLASPTSQYLSALLLAAPLSAGEAITIDLIELNERPYVDMTCWWLDRLGVRYEREAYERFTVWPLGTRYPALSSALPGDYSSASFWFCAAAITGRPVTVGGLDPTDVQGDRAVLDILAELGCAISWNGDEVTVSGRATGEGVFDLNAIPDALPVLAVTAAYAGGPIELGNVPQARAKETDRIAVMANELGVLGVATKEKSDGLVVFPTKPSGGTVSSHGDHRVAMAAAIAALGAGGPIHIADSDAAAVTYPRFFDDLAELFPEAREAARER